MRGIHNLKMAILKVRKTKKYIMAQTLHHSLEINYVAMTLESVTKGHTQRTRQ